MGSARGGSNPLAVGAIARGAMNEKRCLAHGRPLRQNGGSREAPCNRESMVHMCGTRLAQRKTSINHTRRSNNSKNKLLHRWESLYSSVAERQSCKLKVLGSNPSGGWKPAYPRAELGRWSHEHQHATRLARTIKKGIPRGFKIEKHNDSPHMITRCRRNSKHPRRKNAKPTNTHAYNGR